MSKGKTIEDLVNILSLCVVRFQLYTNYQELNLQYLHVVKGDWAGGTCSDPQLVLLLPHLQPLCVPIHHEAGDPSVALGGVKNHQKLLFIPTSLKSYYLHPDWGQTLSLHIQLCNFLLDILYYRTLFSFPFCPLTTGTCQLSQKGWKNLWVLLPREYHQCCAPHLSNHGPDIFYFPWLRSSLNCSPVSQVLLGNIFKGLQSAGKRCTEY